MPVAGEGRASVAATMGYLRKVAGAQAPGSISTPVSGTPLSQGDAVRAAGPLAAIAFAKANGRNPTAAEAAQLVARLGRLPTLGSHAAGLARMGVPTRLQPPNWPAVASDARSNNPVTLLTGKGPVVADDYSPSTGLYHTGSTGGPQPWQSAQNIVQRNGGVKAALHASHPLTAAASVVAG